MMRKTPKDVVEKLLARADVKINGKRPWDMQVKNPKFYARVLSEGYMGFGESFMEGWWDCKDLDGMITRVYTARLENNAVSFKDMFDILRSKLVNLQTKSKSLNVAEKHYNLGNDFYKNMLDPKYMQYTCAYWPRAKNLNKAQEDKLDLVCKKIKLKKGEKVLELGCGWGGFAYYAAKKYGAKVTAYNISREQVMYAREKCKKLPVKIMLQDYREAEGEFDKVVSIGLCEHVGSKNYKELMNLVNRCMKPKGLFLLHTIGGNRPEPNVNAWLDKYIFPGAVIPAVSELSKAWENIFMLEDIHCFGADYDKTLMAWDANFEKNWHKFKEEYGEIFYRMWKLYLMGSAVSFRARKLQLWQLVLSRGDIRGYESVR